MTKHPEPIRILDDPLLTAREAAAHLRIHERTLERWRGRGEGPPAVRLGSHRIRFRRSDLDRWLDGQREDRGTDQ